MRIFELCLLLGLIICALAVSFTKRLLTSIIIYMSYVEKDPGHQGGKSG